MYTYIITAPLAFSRYDMSLLWMHYDYHSMLFSCFYDALRWAKDIVHLSSSCTPVGESVARVSWRTFGNAERRRVMICRWLHNVINRRQSWWSASSSAAAAASPAAAASRFNGAVDASPRFCSWSASALTIRLDVGGGTGRLWCCLRLLLLLMLLLLLLLLSFLPFNRFESRIPFNFFDFKQFFRLDHGWKKMRNKLVQKESKICVQWGILFDLFHGEHLAWVNY